MTAKKQPPKIPAKRPAKNTPGVQGPVPGKKSAKPAPTLAKAPARKVAKKTAPKALTPAQSAAKAIKDKATASKSVADLVGEAHRAAGRPSKYSDEFIPQMIAYFDIETERVEQVVLRDSKGDVILDAKKQPMFETIEIANKFPTLERFASKIGITRETLHDWATATNDDGSLKRPEFSYTYMRAKNLQAALLQEGGLAGNYQQNIAKFALTNLAGWRDQIDATIESSVVPVTKERLDEIYERGIANAKAARALVMARQLDGIVPGVTGDIDADGNE